jgi:glycosyltransferase involved in cell wall biosynthesis
MTPLHVTYLLYDTDISRANRVALAQADALIARGHRVRIVTKGVPLTWRTSRAEWIFVDEFREYNPAADEIVIGAESAILDDITIVDDDLYREKLPVENNPPRVLLVGAYQNPQKGIDDGYGAAAHARWFHQTIELVRVSPWAPSREEPLDIVQEFHVALTTREMTRLMHSCDIILVPSWSEEGFDLPLAEALASGLVAVVSDTPGHRDIEKGPFYAAFAPERNAVELGERLIDVLGDDEQRERLRQRGREVAGVWRAEVAVGRLEEALVALQSGVRRP